MAEVKKEIIEHIFEFEKDNGQSIQLNIMKWGRNSQKYDLRVWDEEKPLKGMTLTEAEVVHLFEELNKKYGKGDVPSITPEVKDSFNMKQFRMVDLKKILIEHPECEYDFNRLRAVLRDYYPKNSLEVNLVLNVCHCGIAGQMKKLNRVNQSDMNRFVNFMEKEFGVKEEYTVGAVVLWAKALGIPCTAKFTPKKNKKEDEQTEPKKKVIPIPANEGFNYGDLIYEDDKIAVSYQGVYKFNGLFAQGHRLRFFVENKTSKTMRVDGKNISVNGIVLNDRDTFNSSVEGKRKIADTVLIYQNNLRAAGIEKVADMKDISIQFEYSFGNDKHRTPDLKLKPYEVKE